MTIPQSRHPLPFHLLRIECRICAAAADNANHMVHYWQKSGALALNAKETLCRKVILHFRAGIIENNHKVIP